MAETTEEKKTETKGVKAFLKKKNIEISAKRYFIDAMGAMANGLFASLLIGTIVATLGQQLHVQVLIDIGTFAKSVSGPAMAVAIAYALQAPPLVLFSMLAVGASANSLGGAGGPLAVLVIAIIATELGKLVSKETKIDILVTPLVSICSGVLLSMGLAPIIGKAASAVGTLIMWATELHPFMMGILVSVIVGIALTLPISSAAICAALNLTGLAGGAAVAGCCAQMVGFAVMSFKENKVGNRNQYATDGKYRKESEDLDRTDPDVCDHRANRDLCIQDADEWRSDLLRYGYLWTCWTDRCLYRMGK